MIWGAGSALHLVILWAEPCLSQEWGTWSQLEADGVGDKLRGHFFIFAKFYVYVHYSQVFGGLIYRSCFSPSALWAPRI